jgi:hypothetical protein
MLLTKVRISSSVSLASRSGNLRQSSGCQQASKRSNCLYTDPLSGKGVPDEKKIFIHDEEPFEYYPQMGGYPDLYNHLLI